MSKLPTLRPLLLTALLLIAPRSLATPSIIAITDPSGALELRTATLVNNEGTIILGQATKEGKDGRVAYRWMKDSGVVMIGDLPGGKILATPTGMSTDGSFVVGTSTSKNGSEAFGWTERRGIIGLGDFEGGVFNSRATDVSADGQIIVGAGTSEGRGSSRRHGDAFVWTRKDHMKPLPDLGTFQDTGWISAISGDGTTMVGKGSNANNRSEAFRYHDNKLQGLGCLLTGTDFYSEAIAVSSDGKTVVGNSGHGNRDRQAFIWTEATGMKALGRIDQEGTSSAVALSDNGLVIGKFDIDHYPKFFIWDRKNGKQTIEAKLAGLGLDLEKEGWFNISRLSSISPNGRFLIGTARRKVDGKTRSDSFLIDLEE